MARRRGLLGPLSTAHSSSCTATCRMDAVGGVAASTPCCRQARSKLGFVAESAVLSIGRCARTRQPTICTTNSLCRPKRCGAARGATRSARSSALRFLEHQRCAGGRNFALGCSCPASSERWRSRAPSARAPSASHPSVPMRATPAVASSSDIVGGSSSSSAPSSPPPNATGGDAPVAMAMACSVADSVAAAATAAAACAASKYAA
eukprot:scaffold107915_cov48-Phaeocystis_antarctica.AAC.1